jgi:hypothetical protein
MCQGVVLAKRRTAICVSVEMILGNESSWKAGVMHRTEISGPISPIQQPNKCFFLTPPSRKMEVCTLGKLNWGEFKYEDTR